MPKRKVLIDCTVDYVLEKDIEGGFGGGWIKKYLMVPVTAEYKSTKNSGGEIWDWAQKNWPDFLDEKGPVVVIDGVEHQSILRWCCVGGVWNAKGTDLLPVENVSYTRHGNPKKRHKKKPAKKKQAPKKTKKLKNHPEGDSSHTPPDNLPAEKKLVEGTDFDVAKYREDKMRKALADDD